MRASAEDSWCPHLLRLNAADDRIALFGRAPCTEAAAVQVVGGEIYASVLAKHVSLGRVFRGLDDARWFVDQAVRLITRPLSRESF